MAPKTARADADLWDPDLESPERPLDDQRRALPADGARLSMMRLRAAAPSPCDACQSGETAAKKKER
jgi:hypothetical protein